MIHDGAALDRMLHGMETDPRTYLLRFYPTLSIPSLDVVTDAGAPLVAEINHGRWIARCPCKARPTKRRPEAPGGVVWLEYPYIWCVRCKNRATAGAWRRVILPADRERIEALLLARPDPETRNWLPSESVADLERENIEHGEAIV